MSDLREAVERGEVYDQMSGDPAPPIYEQDEIVCSLTLDAKQAWVLTVLLAPYKSAEPDNWDIYLAAYDVRRRLIEVLNPKEVR